MGTLYKGTREEIRALNTYIKLMRATSSVSARIDRHLVPHRLTQGQFGTLEALYHLGPMSPSEIGKKLLKSGGNVTLIVDNLEKRGLVLRERSSEDRRVITVRLTEIGEKLIAGIMPEHVGEILREFSALTEREQEELGRLCKKLGLHEGYRDQAPDSRQSEAQRGGRKPEGPKPCRNIPTTVVYDREGTPH